MTVLDAKKYGFDYRALNRDIAAGGREVTVNNCLGQRFIGSGQSGKTITLNGVPGNALGAYLDGADIVVNGNAPGCDGRHNECGNDCYSRQHRRRRGLRHAGRGNLCEGRRRIPCQESI